MAWPAIVAVNYECCKHFEIVSKLLFVFTGHVGEDLGFLNNSFVAGFPMLRNAGMVEFAISSISYVFPPSCGYGPDGMANIYR